MATIVAFHAHPDDEALLTGGTLALLAAGGHRVVIAVATDGVVGAATAPGALRRLDELRASAAVLGAARVVHLGYADSGHGPVLYPDPPDRRRFVRVPVGEAAERLAALLRDEHADVLLSYDPSGGYGHRDHIRVHQVGRQAAEIAGPVRLLEAAVPRELTARIFAAMRFLRMPAVDDSAATLALAYSRSSITHRLDVRRFCAQKRAALTAHSSQLNGKSALGRVSGLLVRLPVPVFGLLVGREWFVEPAAAAPGRKPLRSIL